MAILDSKFSNFADGGDLEIDDIVVGLRDGVNTRFSFQGVPDTYLPLAGGTMEGTIDMDSNVITGLPSPTNPSDAVNKAYVDAITAPVGAVGTIQRSNGTNWVPSTSTFADTYSVNNLLYASSANTVTGLATANSGVLVTSAGGVPSIATDIPTAVTIGGAYIYRVGGTDVAVSDGGTGASTLTGLLTGNGTSAFTGTAITQYNILSGGASNLPNSIAPSATSGVPLISQGAASQPVFGTATVPGGGTGNTTFTAYSLICAGTTATGAFQNVSGVGTLNQVLISQGAGALPIWGSVPGVTPAALTKTDDTNVTMTLGGTPTTALLQATSMTLGWTGELAVGRGGTGLSAITAHYLPIGNGTSALTLLAPSATSGVPLISQGAAADPAYGTAVVAGGGTGNTTFTAYSVLCAGTTATGAFQNVSGVGTAGQVLQSNGAGMLPSWATIPGATSAALTRVDDTNVTLTLGGSPTTALLTATSITAGWSGQLSLARGGSNANLTANDGGIVYSTATAMAILAGTATAGQMLRSGATAAPSWSTATYPATAGTSGNVMTSDGTNFVSSAPAASATSVIVDDTSTNATMYPVWVTANTGSLPLKVTSTKLAFNPSTGLFTVVGNIAQPTGIVSSAGLPLLSFSYVASSVNYVGFTNNTTGNVPAVFATGSDTNIGLQLSGKGTGGAIVYGTGTNDAGSAGTVGEFVSSVIQSGSAITLSDATATNVTSISLTAGDWDVWGNITIIWPSNGGVTGLGWISSSSATVPDSSFVAGIVNPAFTQFSGAVPQLRFSLSGTTTIYLTAYATATIGDRTAAGAIYARRRR